MESRESSFSVLGVTAMVDSKVGAGVGLEADCPGDNVAGDSVWARVLEMRSNQLCAEMRLCGRVGAGGGQETPLWVTGRLFSSSTDHSSRVPEPERLTSSTLASSVLAAGVPFNSWCCT